MNRDEDGGGEEEEEEEVMTAAEASCRYCATCSESIPLVTFALHDIDWR